MTGSKEIKI